MGSSLSPRRPGAGHLEGFRNKERYFLPAPRNPYLLERIGKAAFFFLDSIARHPNRNVAIGRSFYPALASCDSLIPVPLGLCVL
jgi:hypothetical protein